MILDLNQSSPDEAKSVNQIKDENDATNGDKSKESQQSTASPNVPLDDNLLFPYDRIYPEQHRYLKCVSKALSQQGHALIEAPPGTNPALCLWAALTSYQQQQEKVDATKQEEASNNTPQQPSQQPPPRKIVYATHSVPETRRVVRELAVCMEHRERQRQHETTNTNGKRKRPHSRHALLQNVRDGFWESSAAPKHAQDSSADDVIRQYNHLLRSSNAPSAFSRPFLALCLTGADRDAVDEACRSSRSSQNAMTDCDNPPPSGIFASVQDLYDWAGFDGTEAAGHGNGYNGTDTTSPAPLWSSWQELTTHAIRHAHVLIVTYPYLLDPLTARMIGGSIFGDAEYSTTSHGKDSSSNNHNKENQTENTTSGDAKKDEHPTESNLPKSDAVVVLDHAHNIDAAGTDALSATVTLHDLEQATRSLDKLSSELARFRQQQQQQQCHNHGGGDPSSNVLQTEYESLVKHPIDEGVYHPILFPSPDVVREPVPGNIRHTKHFVGILKKIVEHFKVRLRWAAEDGDASTTEKSRAAKAKKTGSVSPLAFLHQMRNATALDAKTLRFVHSRVRSMLRTCGVDAHRDPFVGLLNVAYLASLLGFTHTLASSKFAVVLEHTKVVRGHHGKVSDESNNGKLQHSTHTPSPAVMQLQVVCLDPALAVAPILERVRTVVLTSATLSPLSYYPKILQFKPVVAESIPMTTIRPCVNPIMISRGSDQLTMSTNYKERFTMGCIRNYGKMIVDLVSTIPDGVVVYFPSYNYMEALICEWDATGIMREMTEWKLVFVETKDNLELNAIALDNYRASCDIGRGGVFFSVARGSISESVPFDLHYGRAVVMIGIPYEYTLSKAVRARLEYIQTHLDIREQDYLTFDALRQVSKCFGRVVRSKTDYGVLVFADNRFHRGDKKTKLPGWVGQFLAESQQDLTTDSAVAQIKRFLRQAGQPVDQSRLQNTLVHE